MFAKVIVDIVHSGIDKLFEYRVPDAMVLDVGFRVKVPFGKGNALREGYVLDLSENCAYDTENIKDIAAVLADFPALTAGQIKLAGMIRRYYHTTLACALRLMFPAEMRGGRVGDKFAREVVYSLSDDTYDAFVESLKTRGGKIKAPKQLEVLGVMREHKRLNTSALERIVPQSASARDALCGKGALSINTIETMRNTRRTAEIEENFVLTHDQESAIATIVSARGKYLLHGVTGSGKTEVYIR
ncbi:MAG: hypothetical protein PHO15_10480, partial [Eubacteriales bacterium]|nr:hypothetical protein [Eubacteriales bacterium]